ncbi:MAG: transposase, partial [Firmicutes bacterium]|nr:transposase [Bacillota bacterium]
MSGKKKYSNEFKLQIVMEYLEGKNGSLKILAEKYGIENSQIRKWVNLYREGGVEFLAKTTRTYSG